MKSTLREPTILHKPQINTHLRRKESARRMRNEVGMKPTKLIEQRTLEIDRELGSETLQSFKIKIRPNSAASSLKNHRTRQSRPSSAANQSRQV